MAVEHSLSGLASQKIVLLPVYSVRVVPGLGWGGAIGRPTDVERTLDADILAAFDDKGLRHRWIFAEDLVQSYKRNASYATDPYALSEEFLRSPGLLIDARLPEPLASEMRTLIALHEDVRLVLAPVELRFEPAAKGGRGVLRLVLIDPRYSAVRWIGEVASDSVASYGPVISATIAARLASVVSTP
ncbi:MAG: hypothetical protein ABI442_20090 [Gemmatimonadaceae bacterium]